jgi:flagellar FliJ protein
LPKFIFSLETLLRYREDIEQRERDELMRLTYRYQMELNHRNGLNSRFQETMNEITLKFKENTINQELNWSYLYLNRLTHEINECERRLEKMRTEIQAQKEAVIEASKKKKILASMRTKKEKDFIAATEKQEQKDIDDLVVTRYAVSDSMRARTSEALRPGQIGKHEG